MSVTLTVTGVLPPLLGFAACFYIWLSLRTPAKVVGLVWLVTGLLYGAWKTNGVRRKIEFAAPVEEPPPTSANHESRTNPIEP